jgi:hypothetical protein
MVSLWSASEPDPAARRAARHARIAIAIDRWVLPVPGE